MKRSHKKDQPLQGSEQLLLDLPEPDLSDVVEYVNEGVGRDIEHFYELAASGRLADMLTNIAGLADASDPDPTALVNAINPPSRREH